MDLAPSREQEMLVRTVRDFVRKEIAPLEAELDPDADELRAEDLERLVAITRRMGLHGLDVPAELGGPGLDLSTQVLLEIEMAQHRAGLYAPCYGAFGGGGLAQLYDGTSEQHDKYLLPLLYGEKRAYFALTEPSGGSDPARAVRTTATRCPGGWVLDGTKTFITGADRADFGLVFARADEGITCFIVETSAPGFSVQRLVQTIRRAKPATEILFNRVFVPEENVVGEVGEGLKLANERLDRNRITYAAGCVGVAIRAQEMVIDWSKLRETHGAPLASRQAIQWMIVDNELDIRTSRWLLLDAAGRADRGESFRTEAALGKLAATEAAGRVIDRAVQIHGGAGVSQDLPLERWYREIRIRRLGEGTSEVQRLIAARGLIGRWS